MINKKYPIEKLYISQRNEKNIIVIEDNGYHDFDNIIIYSIVSTLKDFIIDNQLDIYLYNEDGTTKTHLTKQDCENILNLVEIKKTIVFQEEKKLKVTSLKLANVISDLLGINVGNIPRTSINKDEIENIVVSAKKAFLFRRTVSTYIFLSLIKDRRLTISNNDYRILVALKKAHIKTDKILNNTFKIIVDSEDDITITHGNSNKGFQKTIKY